jgi:hypothetical protein
MKRLLVIVVILATPFTVSAESELGVALKGGPNTATLSADNRFGRHGFSGGVASHLRWPLAERFSLGGQVELLYVSRGAEAIFNDVLAAKFRQHYLDVTLAARPAVRFGPASLYLLLGGGLNVLVSASREDPSGEKEDITDGLRRIDVALLAGAGVALHLPHRAVGPFHLGTAFLEVRHDHGLIDIDLMDGGFENRASSLMLGLSFVLGPGDTPPAAGATAAE